MAQISRDFQRSRGKTPRERILSATSYRAFTVTIQIKLSVLAGAVSLDDIYQNNPEQVTQAITLALQGHEHDDRVVDPEVKKISCDKEIIVVELLCRSNQSLQSVKDKFTKMKMEVKEQLNKIGVKEDIDMIIGNKGEMDTKLEQWRLLRRRNIDERGMNETHVEIFHRLWDYVTRDLEAEKLFYPLLSKSIISADDINRVKEERLLRRDRNHILLTALLDKHPDPFNDFVEILSKIQPHIAFKLVKEESEEYKKEHEAFQLFLTDKDAIIRKISRKKEELEDKIYDISNEKDELEKENKSLNSVIVDLKEENVKMKRSFLLSNEGEQNCTQCLILELQKEVLSIELEHERYENKQLVKKSKAIEQRSREIEAEIDQKFTTMIKLTSIQHNDPNEEKIRMLEFGNEELRRKVSEKERELHRISLEVEKERKGNAEKIKLVADRINELEKTIKKMSSEKLQKKLGNKEDENKKNSSELESERKNRQKAENSATNLLREVKELTSVVQEKEKQIKELELLIEQKEKENKQLESKIQNNDMLQSTVQNLTRELEAKKQDIEELELINENIEGEKEKLRSELQEERLQTEVIGSNSVAKARDSSRKNSKKRNQKKSAKK